MEVVEHRGRCGCGRYASSFTGSSQSFLIVSTPWWHGFIGAQ